MRRIRGDSWRRAVVAMTLGALGWAAVPAVLADDPVVEIRRALAAGRHDETEKRLDEVGGNSDELAGHYAAYHATRGTVGAEITRLVGVNSTPEVRRKLAWLYRVSGNLAKAHACEDQTPDASFQRILENRDWPALFAHSSIGPDTTGRALVAELIGDEATRTRVVTGLVAQAKGLDGMAKAWGGLASAIDGLLCLGETARAIELLEGTDDPELVDLRSSLLVGRGRDEEALACWPAAGGSTAAHLGRLELLRRLGDAERTRQEVAALLLLARAGRVEAGEASSVGRQLLALGDRASAYALLIAMRGTAGSALEGWAHLYEAGARALQESLGVLGDGTVEDRLHFESWVQLVTGHDRGDLMLDQLRRSVAAPGRPDAIVCVALTSLCERHGRGREALEAVLPVMPAPPQPGEDAPDSSTMMRLEHAWSSLARLAESCGDWARAERSHAAALGFGPDNGESRLGQARALEQLGRAADALALVEVERLCALGDPGRRISVARYLEDCGRPELGRDERMLAARLDPRRGALAVMGLVRMEPEGRAASDAPTLALALSLYELDHFAFEVRRQRMSQGGRMRGFGLLSVLRLDQIAAMRGLRAQLAAVRGRPDEAIRHARAALDVTPQHDETLKWLARSGLDARAVAALVNPHFEVLAALCVRHPASMDAHNRLAWYGAMARHRLDESLTAARRAVELGPHAAGSYDTLVEVLFQRGELDAATRANETGRAHAPNYAAGYYERHRTRLARSR